MRDYATRRKKKIKIIIQMELIRKLEKKQQKISQSIML